MPKQSKILNFTEPRINYNAGVILHIAKWKKEVVKRDKNICKNCFDSIQDGFRNRKFPHEAHHIVPRHHGGKNTLSNGVTLCKFCHQYYDYMNFFYNMDFHQVCSALNQEQRTEEVKKMMRKRYINSLLHTMYPK